jgi:uncharacterized phage-associated protein
MINQIETSYKKATQALNFFARKKNGKINKMKAIKLIFLADRLHLRKYGRPIVGDVYWAMKLGPVGEQVKNIADLSSIPKGVLLYAKKYIKPLNDKKQDIISLKRENLKVFSKTDIECMEKVHKTFSNKDQFELADITHKYPEWIKYKKDLNAGHKRVRMDYDDFFIDSSDRDDLFAQKKSDLTLAKDVFDEFKEVSMFFAG